MTSSEPNPGPDGYRLKSDLARVCLPTPHANDQRNLAWTNSICLLFLIIGLAGFRSKPPDLLQVKPIEEPAPVVIETPPPPVNQEVKPEEQPQKEQEAPPPIVMVARESPTIRFAVPTPGGNLVVAENLAVPMPAETPQQSAVEREKPAQPTALGNTGKGGDRPQPDYPKMAEDLGQQGTVVLLLTADEAGVIVAAAVQQSSGSSILDRAASDFVKRHWTVAAGARGRLFRASIKYKF